MVGFKENRAISGFGGVYREVWRYRIRPLNADTMTETLTNLCTALMEDTDAAHVTVQYRDAIHSAITYLIIEDGVLTHDAAA